MEAMIAYTILVFFIFAILLLIYGIFKFGGFIYRNNNEEVTENVIGTAISAFFSKIGEKRAISILFIISIVIAGVVVILRKFGV